MLRDQHDQEWVNETVNAERGLPALQPLCPPIHHDVQQMSGTIAYQLLLHLQGYLLAGTRNAERMPP